MSNNINLEFSEQEVKDILSALVFMSCTEACFSTAYTEEMALRIIKLGEAIHLKTNLISSDIRLFACKVVNYQPEFPEINKIAKKICEG